MKLLMFKFSLTRLNLIQFTIHLLKWVSQILLEFLIQIEVNNLGKGEGGGGGGKAHSSKLFSIIRGQAC